MPLPPLMLTSKQIIREYGSFEDYALEVLHSITGGSIIGGAMNMGSEVTIRSNLRKLIEDKTLDMEQLQHVLYPFGKNIGNMTSVSPASLIYYDLLTDPLNKLRGEDLQTPFSFTAVTVNQAAISQFADEKNKAFQMLHEQAINEYAQAIAQPNPEDPNTPIPPDLHDIQLRVNATIKDKVEIDANHRLSYLRPSLMLDNLFNKGWDSLNKYGHQIYFTGTRNNNPSCRLVNIDNFIYDRSGATQDASEAQWAVEGRTLSISEVLNEYGDVIGDDPKLLKLLDDNKGVNSRGSALKGTSPLSPPEITLGSVSNILREVSSTTAINETYICWIGMSRIGFVDYEVEGEILTKQVADDYVVQENEVVEWHWVNVVYEALILNNDIVVYARPRENQYRSLDNIQSVRLPYAGSCDVSLSVVLPVVPLIYKYCEYMHKINLEIAKSMGRVLLFDLAQLPESATVGMPEWLAFLKNSNIAFVDSRKASTVNKTTGETVQSRFNQFTALDLSISESVVRLIQLADRTEMTIKAMIGFNDQRSGDIGKDETATGINVAMQQASASTAFRTFAHTLTKIRVLTNLIEESKTAWKEGHKLKWISDGVTNVHNIIGDTVNSEIGVFVSNDTRFIQMKSLLNQSATAILQANQSNPNNQATMGAVFKALNSNSISETIEILEQSRRELSAIAEKQAHQAQQAQQEHEQAIQDKRAAQLREEREFKASEAQLDRENAILREEIKHSVTVTPTVDTSNEDNHRNLDRALSQSKLLYDNATKLRKQQMDATINTTKNSLKARELDIKEKEIAANKYIAKVNK